MKTLIYQTTGTCCRQITLSYDETTHTITDVTFHGGCHGNLQGLASLLRGTEISHAITRLRGIDCRGKGTSCPDQLAQVLLTI